MAPTIRRSSRPRRAFTRLSLACGVVLLATLPARAEYHITPGDVLSLAVAGVPDLATRVPVDIDGAVTLPLVGAVKVTGLTLADAEHKLQALLPGKEFRRRTEDGHEFPVIIAPGDISLTVAEYRPVYLNGDVAKPGAEGYRPGLTVRQAIALAGGYDVLRFKMDNPFLQLSDLTSEYNQLWIDYAKASALVARLEAERDGKTDLDPKLLTDLPIAPSLAQDIREGERQELAARNGDHAKEQAYLRRASSKESDRARILTDQQDREQEGVKADTADLQRYEDLFRKGAVAMPNLSEARRTVLLSSTRALQTMALLASVDREKGDLDRRLERAGDARRMQVLADLQETTTRLAGVRARLQAASDKLRYTGMVKSQLVRGDDSQPHITIVRTENGDRRQIAGSIDADLQPGDVVEVALQAELPVAAAR